MTIYIGNYMTFGEFEAERDCPSVHDMDLADFSSPQFTSASTSFDEVLRECLNDAQEAVREELEDEDFNVEYNGIRDNWVESKTGRAYYQLISEHVVITIQRLD